jgi:uncharacterized lipoprotein YajG
MTDGVTALAVLIMTSCAFAANTVKTEPQMGALKRVKSFWSTVVAARPGKSKRLSAAITSRRADGRISSDSVTAFHAEP